MSWLIWSGAGVSVLGLLGLFACIFKVAMARKAGLSDDDLKAVVQKVVPLNMGSLFLSVIGIMMVIMGISLG